MTGDHVRVRGTVAEYFTSSGGVDSLSDRVDICGCCEVYDTRTDA